MKDKIGWRHIFKLVSGQRNKIQQKYACPAILSEIANIDTVKRMEMEILKWEAYILEITLTMFKIAIF